MTAPRARLARRCAHAWGAVHVLFFFFSSITLFLRFRSLLPSRSSCLFGGSLAHCRAPRCGSVCLGPLPARFGPLPPAMLALSALGAAGAHAAPRAALMPFWSGASPTVPEVAESTGCNGALCEGHHMDDGHGHGHTLDDGHDHVVPSAGDGDEPPCEGLQCPVKAFNMAAIKNCSTCGLDWCKRKESGDRECITFTLNDTIHSAGGSVRMNITEDNCGDLASSTPYCRDGGEGIYAVAKRTHLPEHFEKAPRVPEETWPTVKRLNELFENGKPSNDLSEVGLVVHCADATERPGQPWLPCETGVCSQFSSGWWSASIISRKLPTTFGGACIILHPERTRLLCAFPWDMGTMTAGCAVEGDRYAPDELEEMMKVALPSAYNEVLIDSPSYISNQSSAIAGFVFGLGITEGGHSDADKKWKEHAGWAHWAYDTFLRAYGLEHVRNRPLLLRGDASAKPGHVFTDVSSGLHEFIAKNQPREPPTQWARRKFRPGAVTPPAEVRAERESRTTAERERSARRYEEGRRKFREDPGGVPEPMSLQDWQQQQEAEQKQERKEMKHNGTKWHMPKATSDCVLGPRGEVRGAAGCKEPPVPPAKALVQRGKTSSAPSAV